MADKKPTKEKLFDRVESVLKKAEIDPLVIKRVREQFFPPIATGLMRPQKRHFKATVLQPRAQCAVRDDEYRYWFEIADVAIEADKDYRIVELDKSEVSDPDWVLLITPKGLDTIVIKNEIFHHGWDVMLKSNPEFEVRKMKDLDLRTRLGAYPLDVPRIFYSRSKASGAYRGGGVVYPRSQSIA